ncbi:hypothetical protein [Aliterella atlantica]|uniref:Uncharacterized protein n=1 Tax=Aliterella atlantica CENA595 TaxID=1618023 RepID=A0A0D8ZWP1_9CYAN|nr:hypothetical protein [Aliterella atlantica]KJH72859.1 hypothetical protein UH38_04735 [Aliterella atlantica CENA595]
MNNNQSTQQSPQLSQQEPPKPSRRQLELLKNHPWLLLVIVAALSVAIAALAVSSLVNIGRVDTAQTSSNPDETTQFSEPQRPKSTNWLLVIFLLGAGTAGGVIVYRRFKTSAMPDLNWQTARNTWQTARNRFMRRKQRKLLLQQSKSTVSVEPQLVSEFVPATDVVTASEPIPATDVVAASEPQTITDVVAASELPIVNDVVAASEPPIITDIVTSEDNNSTSDLEPELFVLSLDDLVVDELPPPAETEVIYNPTEAVVTILPPEDEQPVDPSTRSLVEMMDIRQYLSLSAILQDFKPNKPK